MEETRINKMGRKKTIRIKKNVDDLNIYKIDYDAEKISFSENKHCIVIGKHYQYGIGDRGYMSFTILKENLQQLIVEAQTLQKKMEERK